VLSGYAVSSGFFGAAWDNLLQNQTQGHLRLALADFQQLIGLKVKAKSIYNEVIKNTSDKLLRARAQWSLGKLLVSIGQGPDLDEAIRILGEALQTLKAYNLDVQADAMHNLGQGQYLKAINTQEQEAKARLFTESERWLIQAIQDVKRQRREVPPGWYEHLGQTYEKLFRKSDALAAYQAALEGYKARGETNNADRMQRIISRIKK
jgi:tetratricopeptide (TPR) repeat protein